MIQIKDLSVNKSNNLILKNINLSLDKGLHIIMGPNGCGKTTLAYTIAGHPDCEVINGDILLEQESIISSNTFERSNYGIFLAPQYPPVIEGLSHAALLKESFNSKRYFNNEDPINEFNFLKLLKEKAADFNFNPKTYPRQSFNMGFSGGEKKRNEMLQISLLDPNLIILDEIDSGLDIDAMQFIGNQIQQLSENKTIILITHYPQFSIQLNPQSVHIMKSGTFVAHGDSSLLQQVKSDGFINF